MTENALNGLIAYRLQQAGEALEEARLLKDGSHPRAAVNRAYYAMFYAIQALLAKNGLKASKHYGAIALFDRHFVKPDLFDKEFSRWLHKLFELRQEADYGDMVHVSNEQVREALERATAFVARVGEFLKSPSA